MHPTDEQPADAHSAGHVDDQVLAALALGEADELDEAGGLVDGELTQARAHLDSCARCTEELAALQETFALVAASGDDHVLTAPPPRLWAAIAAQIAQEQAPAPQAQAPVTALAARRRGVPTWLAATAAAVTLLLGAGAGWLVADRSTDSPAPQASVVSTAELATLDETAQARGRAEVRRAGDEVELHVRAQGLGGPDGMREVWLINLDGTRMVSLGLLPDGEAGDFEFPSRLLDEGYQIVDISYEPGDGDPTHSGESLARGTLQG